MEEPAIRQGAYVTAAYFLVFYASLIGQSVAKNRLIKSYKARGERVRLHRNTLVVKCLALCFRSRICALCLLFAPGKPLRLGLGVIRGLYRTRIRIYFLVRVVWCCATTP